jgi:hypothetical protein
MSAALAVAEGLLLLLLLVEEGVGNVEMVGEMSQTVHGRVEHGGQLMFLDWAV